MQSLLGWVVPSSIKEAYEQWLPPVRNILFRKIWNAVFFIILWTVWKERNAIISGGNSCSLIQLKDLILLRLIWWIKGWGDPFPYSDEITRNPMCLKWQPTASPPSLTSLSKPADLWFPPPLGLLKWNVDASINQFQNH